MPPRAKLIALLGLILVPTVTYYGPVLPANGAISAYLITRTEKFLGNWRFAGFLSCLLSAAIFGLAHWYQGAVGMLITGMLGLVLGIVFLLQDRNLWTNIAAHLVADTVSSSFISLNWDRPLDVFGRALFEL
jgi:CAAX protease family protein